MERDIVKINEELCDGCGNCVPGCHEGALQIIVGKARLVSDLMCDGLGACLGNCPQGAITIEKREAEPYDEGRVMEIMTAKGKNTVIAHMKHLKDHNETGFLKQAVSFLKEHQENLSFDVDEVIHRVHNHAAGCDTSEKGGCPGSASIAFNIPSGVQISGKGKVEVPSALSHWPVQLHLINPEASHFEGADLLLSADCVAYSLGNFHSEYLRGRCLAIACPKLDQGPDIYVEKLITLIDQSKINTIHLMVMEVPCCSGLERMVQIALSRSNRRVPVKKTTISIKGEVLHEDWAMA